MVLEYRQICKKFGQQEVLKGISCCISEGVCALLGPNGAGKSTLMNITVGNLNPDEGRIFLDGKPVDVLSDQFRSGLGYMPQQQALYPEFSVERFLQYVAALRGMDKARAEKRILQVLHQVGLEEVGHKKIRTLSGGMKQRLLIGQAILDEPKVLILDEPTAGLDPKQRIAIRNLIAQIALHRIVILATHIVSDVEYIANDILVLKEGRVLRHGSCAELAAEIEGKVFELQIPEEKLSEITEKYRVGNIVRGENCLYVRVLSNERPQEGAAREIRPELEDVWLWHFGA